MRTGTVTSPDGREWTITVHRIRWPHWRDSRYEPDDTTISLYLLGLLAAPIFWFVIPLVVLVLEAPVAMVRGLGSDRRWIEARCIWPAEIVMRWETTQAHAEAAAEEILARLANGYDDLTPTGSCMTEMTPPPGAEDRDD